MTTRLPVETAELDDSIVRRWRRIVQCFPQATAVTTVDGRSFTYDEVDLLSNRIANALLERLDEENCPVLLLLDHSYQLIVSIMGAIKANKAYVALDPRQAAGELQLLSQGAAAPLVVTSAAHMELACAVAAEAESTWSVDALPAAGSHAPAAAISADSMASIIFTSGTMEQPKGVAYPHRMVLHRVWFEDGISCFRPGHRIAGIRPCGLGAGISLPGR